MTEAIKHIRGRNSHWKVSVQKCQICRFLRNGSRHRKGVTEYNRHFETSTKYDMKINVKKTDVMKMSKIEEGLQDSDSWSNSGAGECV